MKTLSFSTILILVFIAAIFYYFFIQQPSMLFSQPSAPIIKYSDDVLQVEFKYPSKIFELTSNVPLHIIVKNEGPKTVTNIRIYSNYFPFYIEDISVDNPNVNCIKRVNVESIEAPWSLSCSIDYLESKDVVDIILLISTPEILEQVNYKIYDIIITASYDYSIMKSFTIPLLNEDLSKYTETKPSFSKDETSPIKIVPQFDITNEYQTPTQTIRGEWVYSSQPFMFNIDFAQKGKVKAEEVKIVSKNNDYFYIRVTPADLVKQEVSFCNIGSIQASSGIKDNSFEFDFSQRNFNLVDDGRDFDIELGGEIIMGRTILEKAESVKCTINFYAPEVPELHPNIEIYLPFTYKFLASTKIKVYSYS